MGSYLYHRYETDGTVGNAAVREALAELTDDDVSVSSPVKAGGDRLGTAFEVVDGVQHLVVSCAGFEGDWTKTSEEAVRQAVQSVDGVGDLVESKGGYDG